MLIRLLGYLGRLVRLVLLIALYALVLWYGVETASQLNTHPTLTTIAVALIALGVAGSTYRILVDVAKETKGAIVVIADFLNTHLVEPQKRRLLEQGRTEGRAEGRAEAIADIRSRLLREGIDPDRIIPPRIKATWTLLTAIGPSDYSENRHNR